MYKDVTFWEIMNGVFSSTRQIMDVKKLLGVFGETCGIFPALLYLEIRVSVWRVVYVRVRVQKHEIAYLSYLDRPLRPMAAAST